MAETNINEARVMTSGINVQMMAFFIRKLVMLLVLNLLKLS